MTATLEAPGPRAARTRPAGSDFAPLSRQVRDSGLLERRLGYYTRAIALNVAATAGVWAAAGWLGASWWVLALALPLALLSGRTAFLSHDAGHRQIARSPRVNKLLGLVLGNGVLGMSYGWWNDKHNRHHANPNHVDKDPDVGPGPLVWTSEQARRRRRGPLNWLARHQARLFFPMLLLEGLNLQFNSVKDLKNRTRREQLIEGALLAAHAGWYLGLAFTLLSPGKAVAFLLLHQALFGVHLGSVFAPNHKGMQMPEGDQKWDHLRRQVLTSRNVRGGRFTDWLMGGLNYQIEHHLFPSLPRPNLRKVQPMVREHCARVGLPFTETGLLDSYRQALTHMHDVAEPLRH
jgi:fatty acid desaturase